MKILLRLLCGMWAVGVVGVPVKAQVVFNQIALSSDPAPGTDTNFGDFIGAPTLNNAGDVAFAARLGSGIFFFEPSAIFGPSFGAGSPLGLIALQDGAVPGTNEGVVFGDLEPSTGTVALNDAGDVAFLTFFFGEGIEARGVFGPTAGAGSPLGLLVQEGVVAPSAVDGAIITRLGTFSEIPLLNNAGDVAVSARLTFPGAESSTNAILGPTSGAGSPLGVLVQAGNVPPGAPEEALFGSVGSITAIDPVSLNNSSDVAFHASFSVPSQGFRRSAFGPTAGAGSPLGLIPLGEDFLQANTIFNFNAPALNDVGDLAFGALLDTRAPNRVAVILGPTAGAGSPLGILAQEGELVPGVSDEPELFFLEFEGQSFRPSDFVLELNNEGDVAFVATIAETPDPIGSLDDIRVETAILGPTAGAGSPLGVVALTGEIVPGVAGDFRFTSLFDNSLAINDAGDVAFLGSFSDGETEGAGLFATVDGELQLVVRTQDSITVELADGSFEERTIEGIRFGGLTSVARQLSFNNDGLLAFELDFASFLSFRADSGIFTADTRAVPEPSSLALLTLTGLATAVKKRRRISH